MKRIDIKATTGSKKDNTLKEFTGKVDQFETLAEAVKLITEAKCLEAVNYVKKVNALNALRVQSSADPKKAMIKKMLASMNDEQMNKLIASAEKLGIKLPV